MDKIFSYSVACDIVNGSEDHKSRFVTECQIRLRIYVGYESPSIIRYLEPRTCDVFMARFADCHFNEAIFSALG